MARQTTPALVRIVQHCLEKKPEQRFQSTRDLAFDLETLSEPQEAGPTLARSRARWVPVALALLASVAAIAGSWWLYSQSSGKLEPARLAIALAPGVRSEYESDAPPVISPDGKTIVYQVFQIGRAHV